ncbi:MAG: sodium:solute symporter family protein [Pseudomonadota bacterium]
MDGYSLTIAISVILFAAIGAYSGRSVKSIDDYFVAGRRAPTLLIMGTLVASLFSTSVFLGEAGFTYDGWVGPYLLLPGIAITGYIYGALFFGTFLRRSRAPTVADYLGQRFRSRRVQQAAGATIVLGLGGYLLVVTQGSAILLADITPLSYGQAVVVAWLSYTAFTLYAGSKGVVITDTLMFLLFCGATVLFGYFVFEGFGGVSQALETLTRESTKPHITSWHGTIGEGTDWPTAWDFLIWLVIVDSAWSLVYAVGPWQASRHLMAKDEHVVLRGAIYASFAIIFLQILIYGTGGIINLANPAIEPSERVIVWASQRLVPELLGALMLAGIAAAGLSSASTFLSLVGFSLSNDIGPKRGALELRATRLLMGTFAVVVLVLALNLPANVFWIMLFIGTVFASSWGPVALMSVWSRSITANGAFWGIVAGFIGNVVPAALVYFGVISLPSYLDPAVLGGSASLLVIFLFARREQPSAEERAYREQLHQTPKTDRDAAKARVTLIAPMLLVAYGVLMPLLLLNFYVRPVQRGRGTIGPGDSLNWAEAEPWIAFGPALLFVPLGFIAAHVIWHRYSPRVTLR